MLSMPQKGPATSVPFRAILACSALVLCAVVTYTQTYRQRSVIVSETSCFNVSDDPVAWTDGERKCKPDVCGGTFLRDIPDLEKIVPANVICGARLYDTPATRQCLQGKRVVILGDSTMTENVHDIIILLSGIGSSKEATDEYLGVATRQSKFRKSSLDVPEGKPQAVHIDFLAAHRHMLIRQNLTGVSILHRFTGHINFTENRGGVGTFNHPDFQKDLRCFLGEDPVCEAPDILIINSGFHDAAGTDQVIASFEGHMAKLAPRLKALTPRTKVVWVSSHAYTTQLVNHVRVMGLDSAAARAIRLVGLPFVDLTAVMRAIIPVGASDERFTLDRTHWGAIAKYKDMNYRLTISSMMTQRILEEVCG